MSAEAAAKRKVLHIIHSFGSGGVETWLLSAVKYLKLHPELNLQFDFLVTGGVPAVFDDEIKRNGSEIYYNRYSYSTIRSFRSNFRELLKHNNYIAVHDHQDFVSGWHYLLGGRDLPAVRIVHLHNHYNFVRNYIVNQIRWLSYKIGRTLMVRYATKITGTSDAVMDEYGYNLSPFSKKRVYPAYCGFDTNIFRYNNPYKAAMCKETGWEPSVKIALFVGRISLQNNDSVENQKNPEFAMKIARELVCNHDEWRFLFVGYKGETGERMEKEINEQSLGDRIKFLGIRKDIPQIMSASDVFIFPSLWEGLGMVAVEAQCSGLKVIMSDTVPKESIVCPEIVTSKSIDEEPSAWVDVILKISLLHEDRKKYAEKIRLSPFSIENSTHRLMDLYES